ncbi:MAG TPA: hypothetical protein VLB50_06625, partial [Ignavibacteriaceae bacterium]|nr:hypothetical protein [Ignavibacteriaceae bacterium]
MLTLQFPSNELGEFLEKILPSIKKKKFRFIFIYILTLFYFSIPAFQIPYFEFYHFRITSLMEQRAIDENLLYYPQQSWVNIENVNPNLLKAIISMEDGEFFFH